MLYCYVNNKYHINYKNALFHSLYVINSCSYNDVIKCYSFGIYVGGPISGNSIPFWRPLSVKGIFVSVFRE